LLYPFDCEGRNAHSREAALLIQEVQDSQRLLLNEVQNVLVVHKGDIGPVDLLPLVLSLLHLEDMLIEVLLQLLVGQIDAELLKVILLEGLKSCMPRKANLRGLLGRFSLLDCFIQLCDSLARAARGRARMMGRSYIEGTTWQSSCFNGHKLQAVALYHHVAQLKSSWCGAAPGSSGAWVIHWESTRRHTSFAEGGKLEQNRCEGGYKDVP